jgi:hypothetical protein
VGRFLDLARGQTMPGEKVSKYTSSTPSLLPFTSSHSSPSTVLDSGSITKKTNYTKEAVTHNPTSSLATRSEAITKDTKEPTDNLAVRLFDLEISIAIDHQTGNALLVFSESDREAVRHVASVYHPFDVVLTPSQRAEVQSSLDYYEHLRSRGASVVSTNSSTDDTDDQLADTERESGRKHRTAGNR